MKTGALFFLHFVLAGFLFAADYTIDDFCTGERSIPPQSNAIIESAVKGTLAKTVVNEKLKPGELMLRIRFSTVDYCLYKGVMAPNALQQDLFVYPIPKGMYLSQMLKQKYYTSVQNTNPDQDIFKIFIDNVNIFVELYATIYWNDNGIWRSLKGISVKDPKAKTRLWGDINITFTPPESDVFIDQGKQKPQNPGNIFIANLYPGDHLVSVRRTGYQTIEKLVMVKPGEIIPESVVLPPAYGTVVIASDPRGAQVKVSSVKKGQALVAEGVTPLTQTYLEPGEYVIQIRSTDELYLPVTDTVTVQMNDTTKVFKTLVPNFGLLYLLAIDSGFSYMVDGIPTQADQRRVTPGRHKIAFDGRELYQSMDTTIEIEAGSQYTIGKECVRLTGGIKIVPNPLDAEVFIDGEKIGFGPKVVENIPTGNHVALAKRAGYKLTKANVFVKDGEVQDIALTLPQIPDQDGDGVEDNYDECPDDPGTVNGCRSTAVIDYKINSNPQGAVLSENKKALGYTPCTVSLREGKHFLQLTLSSFVDTTVEINATQSDELRFNTTRASNRIDIEMHPTETFIKQVAAEKQARLEAAAQARERFRKGFKLTRQITFGGLGAVLAGAGYYFNTQYDKSYQAYSSDKTNQSPGALNAKWDTVDKNKKNRDLMYMLAGVCGGLFTVSFVF